MREGKRKEGGKERRDRGKWKGENGKWEGKGERGGGTINNIAQLSRKIYKLNEQTKQFKWVKK